VPSYDAKINVLLSGLRDLVLLEDRLEKIGSIVNTLNKTPIALNVGGRGKERELSGQLSKEVNDYVREWVNGGKNIGKSINAVRQQQAAFNELLRETALIQQDKKAEVAVNNLAQAWADTTRAATEYDKKLNDIQRKALGLQPQAVRDLEVAGRETFVQNERRRRATATAALEDDLRLQQALLQLEEKSAAAANKELQARGEIARLSAQGVNAAAFRAAQTGTQIALPAFQERGLKLLDDSVRANESNRRIEQALNGERKRGVRFLEKQTAEERRQVELGILGQRTNRLAGGGRPNAPAPVGGFPVSGPLTSPGFGKTQKQVGKFGENLALGAGFPLLFGGGPGAVAGSTLGSFVGSGFGGQILGGAIGQILDGAIQKTAQLGSALQTLDISQIEESGVRINANLETQISLLRQTGSAYAAQQLLQQEVYATTGAIPGTIEGISDSVNVLSSAWSEFTAAAGATLGIVGAPFAAALGAALRIVNLILKGFNVAASGLGGLIQKTGEWVVELVAGGEALKNIQDYFESLNPAIDEARGKYAPILSDLNSQVLLNRELLELEKQKTTGKTSEGKDRNLDLTAQQKILTINAEIDNEIREVNKDITEATKSQVEEAVRLLNVKRNQKVEEIQIESVIQRQRAAEDARDKAAREAARAAEEAARAAEQRTKALLNINKDYLTDQLKRISLTTQELELFKGAEVALEAQLQLTQVVGKIRVDILETERDLALAEAAKLGTTKAVVQQYALKFTLLQKELDIEQKVTEQKLAQTKLDKQLRIDALQRDKEQAIRGIQTQQNNVGLNIAAFTTDPKIIEAARLQLDQRNRAYETELAVQTEIDKLNREIASSTLNEDELTDKQRELDIQKSKLSSLREELTLLDSLEQRQLRLQQFYQTYGQLIQSVSGEIANAVTFGVSEMVRGTKTAEEVFAQFLNSVGEALLSAAQQMIASYIAIGIAKIFAGMGGGGVSNLSAPATINNPLGNLGSIGGAYAKGGSFANGIQPFASGGVVNSPTMFKFADGGTTRTGLMGEAGPEAIMPLKRGSDGSLGVQATGLREAMGRPPGGANGSTVLNMSFQSTTINGTEYVSRDQLEAAMAATRRQAAKEGANRGMNMTLDKIQNSPSTRSRAGIR
jgi:lambda family phage tail tape measure protein